VQAVWNVQIYHLENHDRQDVEDEMTCCEKTEKETIERCAKFVEGGRFLHDGAPTAIFGRECAAAMRRALLPAPQVEPEDLPHPGTGRLLHASPVFAPQVEKREECEHPATTLEDGVYYCDTCSMYAPRATLAKEGES
jgi:hypothetical protein